MGYVKYHYNQTMTESMLNQFEKDPEYTVTSGTTHYHYISPYYAGDWLEWHIPTYHSDGYYTYATTSHSKSNDDPQDSSYEDGDKYDYYYNFNAITGVNFLNHSGYNNVGLYVGDKTTANNLTFERGYVSAGESASRATVRLSTSDTSKVCVPNPVPDTPPADFRFPFLLHKHFPHPPFRGCGLFCVRGGGETCDLASIQRFKLNIQAYQPITHNI